MLDRLMLEVIRREPERIEPERIEPARIEPALSAMFAGNPPARVLRFLDEDSSLIDELRLVASMPPAAFLRAAARLAGRR
jgi:lycopene beta-cyclase